MSTSAKKKLLLEWTVSRDDAEALLKSLIDAKTESERRLAELDQSDVFRDVTGRSAIDNAIKSTRRMVDTFNRLIGDMQKELGEGDLELLEPGS
jgi:hypothetical protein